MQHVEDKPGENMVMRLSLARPSASVSSVLALPSPTITAAAPRSCAARIFVAKSHDPRSTSAIVYGSSGGMYRSGGKMGGTQAKKESSWIWKRSK